MDKYAEIKDILHDILGGYQARNESALETINISLDKIDKHLEKLNGKVAEHEKVINVNLPHNIALCPQADNIKSLQENMITSKTVKNTLYIGFGILATLIGIIWGILEILSK